MSERCSEIHPLNKKMNFINLIIVSSGKASSYSGNAMNVNIISVI